MNRNERTSRDRVAVYVFGVLTANALTAFALQAWMTFYFAADVWNLPVPLCVALIVALDLFAVMFMMLTYFLRGTGWPRFAVTMVFLFAIASQVFAAEQFGEHEKWSTAVRWFSALPAVLLALSQEGVILWRTHRADLATKDKKKAADPEPERPAPAERKTVSPTPEPVKAPAPSARGRRGRKTGRGSHDDIAAKVVAGQVKVRDVAAEQGVSPRAVQGWVAAYRAQNPGPAPAEPVAPSLNGREFRPEVEVSTNGTH